MGRVKRKSVQNKQIQITLCTCTLISSGPLLVIHTFCSSQPMILLADSECPDQTAWTFRLIWTFFVRICPKIFFARQNPYILSPNWLLDSNYFLGIFLEIKFLLIIILPPKYGQKICQEDCWLQQINLTSPKNNNNINNETATPKYDFISRI